MHASSDVCLAQRNIALEHLLHGRARACAPVRTARAGACPRFVLLLLSLKFLGRERVGSLLCCAVLCLHKPLLPRLHNPLYL